jgi:tetratricopeptide (TPR) repeat protein
MTCLRVVLVLALAASVAVHADSPSADYRAAVAAYRKGDSIRAAELIGSIGSDAMKRAASSLIAETGDWRVPGAAALLHTEMVISGRARSKSDMSLHIGIAFEIVNDMQSRFARAGGDTTRELTAFRERWYSLAATVFLAATDPGNASRFVSRGLSEFKKSARLVMLEGVIEEMRAHLIYSDLHDRSIIAAMKPTPARQHQLYAITKYQTALEDDPSLTEARVRLGRSLALVNRVGPAREALQLVAATSDDSRNAYLAQLFLGALSSYQRDYASARESFQAALDIFPTCQTPYIALAFVERMTGHDAAARELFDRFSSRRWVALEADPWWAYQNGGLDDDGLTWMQGRVRE